MMRILMLFMLFGSGTALRTLLLQILSFSKYPWPTNIRNYSKTFEAMTVEHGAISSLTGGGRLGCTKSEKKPARVVP